MDVQVLVTHAHSVTIMEREMGRRPWVMKRNTAHPAWGATPPGFTRRPRKGDRTTSLIIVVVVMACAGWMAWSCWTYWRTPSAPQPSAESSPQTRAFEAFAHGNRCLAAGQWADAAAAFERARALDPKRAYVAERLAEVERRQHTTSATAPVAAGG
jgi:hypothetical protein